MYLQHDFIQKFNDLVNSIFLRYIFFSHQSGVVLMGYDNEKNIKKNNSPSNYKFCSGYIILNDKEIATTSKNIYHVMI